MVHELKTREAYFKAIESGEKSFELRKNDHLVTLLRIFRGWYMKLWGRWNRKTNLKFSNF